jgi:hypothetical protein
MFENAKKAICDCSKPTINESRLLFVCPACVAEELGAVWIPAICFWSLPNTLDNLHALRLFDFGLTNDPLVIAKIKKHMFKNERRIVDFIVPVDGRAAMFEITCTQLLGNTLHAVLLTDRGIWHPSGHGIWQLVANQHTVQMLQGLGYIPDPGIKERMKRKACAA